MATEGRWDAIAWDDETGGWDVDTQVYVSTADVERSLKRTAAAKVVRQDDAVLKRGASPRLTRRQE